MLQQDPLDVAAFSVLENFSYGQPGGVFFARERNAQMRRTQLLEYARDFGFELDRTRWMNSALRSGNNWRLCGCSRWASRPDSG